MALMTTQSAGGITPVPAVPPQHDTEAMRTLRDAEEAFRQAEDRRKRAVLEALNEPKRAHGRQAAVVTLTGLNRDTLRRWNKT